VELFNFFPDKSVVDNVEAIVKCASVVDCVVAESAAFMIEDAAFDFPVWHFAKVIYANIVPDIDFFASVIECSAVDLEIWFIIGGGGLFVHGWSGSGRVSVVPYFMYYYMPYLYKPLGREVAAQELPKY
jgi:hypothetical protein